MYCEILQYVIISMLLIYFENCLQATVDSLHTIVNQKEETIGRFQQLLKESRDEHSQAAARLQEELRSLQTALNNSQQSYNR
jgi:uncharacterized coiled-coil DUF342 family protein